MTPTQIKTTQEIAHILKTDSDIAHELKNTFESPEKLFLTLDLYEYYKDEEEEDMSSSQVDELVNLLIKKEVPLSDIMQYYREAEKE